jgi:uncharacterized protein with PQ loop repeat
MANTHGVIMFIKFYSLHFDITFKIVYLIFIYTTFTSISENKGTFAMKWYVAAIVLTLLITGQRLFVFKIKENNNLILTHCVVYDVTCALYLIDTCRHAHMNIETRRVHMCSRSYQIEIVYFTWFWKMEKKVDSRYQISFLRIFYLTIF